MNVDATLLYVLSIVCIATLIRSAFGFGEVLVAVPLLAFRIPFLAGLVSITVAAIVVVQDSKKSTGKAPVGWCSPACLVFPWGFCFWRAAIRRR
jgi:hypothetical protein